MVQKKKNIILLVDNNINRRNNLGTRLRMLGYTPEVCSSGMQAISLLEKSDKARITYRSILIIGDSEDMPGREVMLLMREIEKDKGTLPILIVDEDNDPENILQAIHEGANDYIVDVNNDVKIVKKLQKIAPLLEE